MLRELTARRDRDVILVVKEIRKLIFVGDDDDDERTASLRHKWNDDHKELFRICEETRKQLIRTAAVQAWVPPHLTPQVHSKEQACERLARDSKRGISVETELVDLKSRRNTSKEWEQRLKIALGTLWDFAIHDILDRAPAQSPAERIFNDPWFFLRIRSSDSHSKYDDTLGIICSDWLNCQP